MALCLGTYGDPRELEVSYERRTPVQLASGNPALAWESPTHTGDHGAFDLEGVWSNIFDDRRVAEMNLIMRQPDSGGLERFVLHQMVFVYRCPENVAHMRRSRPDSALGFNVDVHKTLQVVPSLCGSGYVKYIVFPDFPRRVGRSALFDC